MGTKNTGVLPARLEVVRGRFERWRRTRKVRTRIPEPLWAAAVKMAGEHGVHRTARALRVNYYALKKRAEREAVDARSADTSGAAATFLELASLDRSPFEPMPSELSGDLRAGFCQCTLEWENAAGAKMRICLKGAGVPDLAMLSREFWRGES